MFFTSNGAPYWYNFCTNEETKDVPFGMDADQLIPMQIQIDYESSNLQVLVKVILMFVCVLCICVYVCMYVYKYKYVCMYMHTYIHTYVGKSK